MGVVSECFLGGVRREEKRTYASVAARGARAELASFKDNDASVRKGLKVLFRDQSPRKLAVICQRLSDPRVT